MLHDELRNLAEYCHVDLHDGMSHESKCSTKCEIKSSWLKVKVGVDWHRGHPSGFRAETLNVTHTFDVLDRTGVLS